MYDKDSGERSDAHDLTDAGNAAASASHATTTRELARKSIVTGSSTSSFSRASPTLETAYPSSPTAPLAGGSTEDIGLEINRESQRFDSDDVVDEDDGYSMSDADIDNTSDHVSEDAVLQELKVQQYNEYGQTHGVGNPFCMLTAAEQRIVGARVRGKLVDFGASYIKKVKPKGNKTKQQTKKKKK